MAALHRRGAIRGRRHEQDAALSEDAASRIVLGERHTAEETAFDVGNPVMPREPLVHECVIRIEQIDDAAVLAQDALEEQLHLALEAMPEIAVEIGDGSGSALSSSRRRIHCEAKLSMSDFDFGSASIRRVCCSSTAGLESSSGNGEVEQRVVGNAAPQEEGQARRKFQVGQADRRRPGGRFAGTCSMRKMNCGSTSTRASARWIPISKPPSLRPS